MTKITLATQIKALERNTDVLRKVYAARVQAGQMSQVVADAEIGAMERVKASMQWVENHEDTIRMSLAERRDLEEHPAVQAIRAEGWSAEEAPITSIRKLA